MSIFNDKIIKSVAEAVAKIMAQESSHGTEPKSEKEKSLAALAHPKDKITHKDVLVGRGVLKKEEYELDESDAYDYDRYAVKNGKAVKDNPSHMGSPNYKDQPHHVWASSPEHALKKHMKKEDVEQLDELSPNTIHNYKAGRREQQRDLNTDAYVDADTHDAETKKIKKGISLANRRLKSQGQSARTPRAWPYVLRKEDVEQLDELDKSTMRSYVNKAAVDIARSGVTKGMLTHQSNKEIMSKHIDKRLKGIDTATKKLAYEETDLSEEPDNEQWTKELKDQEATAAGKKKPASVAAPSTMGVKTMKEEEQLDELKSSTLARYIGKSQQSARDSAYHAGAAAMQGKLSDSEHLQKKERKRAVGIMQATHKLARRAVGEEVEQIEELSKDTLKSYVDKAATRLVAGDKYKGMDRYNRVEGIKKATSKLAKEEVEQIEERSLTEPEMEKKEKYVKGMKKKLSGFKERYGDRAKSVMYATAAKMAKED